VKPARFEYVRPETVTAALELLACHGSEAAILAGGQSLVPMLNFRMARPGMLIDINRIRELDRIELQDGALIIGARARHSEVLRSQAVHLHAPLLPQALKHVAHAAIRNRGTLGGSLALADPAAELPACMVCLGAQITVASQKSERAIRAEDFFSGLYTTACAANELLLRVAIPFFDSRWRFDFSEVARRRGDFALAGLAFAVCLANRRIEDCRIAVCGVEAAPRRLRKAEHSLIGAELENSTARTAACAALVEELEPMSSGDCPAEYRLHVASALLNDAVDRLAREESIHGDD
jgi:aerobic carbon-monoxide dehydrogenase medium subunit